MAVILPYPEVSLTVSEVQRLWLQVRHQFLATLRPGKESLHGSEVDFNILPYLARVSIRTLHQIFKLIFVFPHPNYMPNPLQSRLSDLITTLRIQEVPGSSFDSDTDSRTEV